MQLDDMADKNPRPISLAQMLDILDKPVPTSLLKTANKGKAGEQLYIDWTDVCRVLGNVCPTFDIQILSWSQEQIGSSGQLIMTGRLTMRDEMGNSLSVDQVAWADLGDSTFGGAFPKAYARLIRRLGATVGIGRDLYNEEDLAVIKRELNEPTRQPENKHSTAENNAGDRAERATKVGQIQWCVDRLKDISGTQVNVKTEGSLSELENILAGLSKRLRTELLKSLASKGVSLPENGKEFKVTELLAYWADAK